MAGLTNTELSKKINETLSLLPISNVYLCSNEKGAVMLSLKIHHLGEVAVFECSGRITAEDSSALRNAVLAQTDGHMVVLDLKEVSQIDAAGLGVLVGLRNWAQNSGKELKLMNLMPRVERVMEITRLRSVFSICSAREMLDLWCRAIHSGVCSASAPYKLAASF